MGIKIDEAMGMSKREIEAKLKEYSKTLESYGGMNHVEACDFLSSIMNLGIAAQKLWDAGVR